MKKDIDKRNITFERKPDTIGQEFLDAIHETIREGNVIAVHFFEENNKDKFFYITIENNDVMSYLIPPEKPFSFKLEDGKAMLMAHGRYTSEFQLYTLKHDFFFDYLKSDRVLYQKLRNYIGDKYPAFERYLDMLNLIAEPLTELK